MQARVPPFSCAHGVPRVAICTARTCSVEPSSAGTVTREMRLVTKDGHEDAMTMAEAMTAMEGAAVSVPARVSGGLWVCQ